MADLRQGDDPRIKQCRTPQNAAVQPCRFVGRDVAADWRQAIDERQHKEKPRRVQVNLRPLSVDRVMARTV